MLTAPTDPTAGKPRRIPRALILPKARSGRERRATKRAQRPERAPRSAKPLRGPNRQTDRASHRARVLERPWPLLRAQGLLGKPRRPPPKRPPSPARPTGDMPTLQRRASALTRPACLPAGERIKALPRACPDLRSRKARLIGWPNPPRAVRARAGLARTDQTSAMNVVAADRRPLLGTAPKKARASPRSTEVSAPGAKGEPPKCAYLHLRLE